MPVFLGLVGAGSEGFSVVDIGDATGTLCAIKTTIGEDGDNVVNVYYNLGHFIHFSETVVSPAGSTVAISYDPPGEADEPVLGPCQQTAFDGILLSERGERYRHLAVNWFAFHVLGRYIRSQKFILDPTVEVQELAKEVLGGRLPRGVEDIASLICDDPNLLHRIQCVRGDFDPEQLSPAAREACLGLLEDVGGLEGYLSDPERFIRKWAGGMTPEEREALVRVAREQPALVRNAFDSVELGGARGDGNTYILIGLDRKRNLPDQKGWEWLGSQMEGFVARNGFLPSCGYYVTEAQSCQRIILGPGVTDRERDFLQFSGHELIDKRDGGLLEEQLRPPAGSYTGA